MFSLDYGRVYRTARSSDRFGKAGGAFDDDQIDSFIELKMVEVIRFEMTPHPVEYDMYCSVESTG